MKTNTRAEIFKYIKTHKKVSAKKLVDRFEISAQMVHRHLKKLLLDEKISKVGKPPKVFYISKDLPTSKETQPGLPKYYSQGAYNQLVTDKPKEKKVPTQIEQKKEISKTVDKKTTKPKEPAISKPSEKTISSHKTQPTKTVTKKMQASKPVFTPPSKPTKIIMEKLKSRKKGIDGVIKI